MDDLLRSLRYHGAIIGDPLGPFRKDFDEARRQIDEFAKVHELAIAPALREFALVRTNVIEPMMRMIENHKRMMAAMEQRQKKIVVLVKAIGWPPPGHLPCTTLDRIADAFEAGEVTKDEIEDFLVEAYSSKKLLEIKADWLACEWLKDRIQAIEEAFANIDDGRYYSATCVLILQIEGIIAEVLGKKHNAKVDTPEVFRDSSHGVLFQEFYLQIIRKDFIPGDDSQPIPELSRHAFAHGCVAVKCDKIHGVKVILVLDFLIGCIKTRRNELAESIVSAIET